MIAEGNKIDYVLADDKYVYLVELKTTEDSYSDEQMKIYRKLVTQTFGKSLGTQLIRILRKSCNISFKSSEYTAEALFDIWEEFIKKTFDNGDKKKNFDTDISIDFGSSKHEVAKRFIKEYGWPWRGFSSRKYFYTLGQILDYLDYDEINEANKNQWIEKANNNLWEKKQKVVYLMPSKEEISKEDNENFVSISLLNDKENGYLKDKIEEGDPLAECICEAMRDIFDGSTWRVLNGKN